MPQLRLRMARREDTPEIVALMNATFRTPMDEATWAWYVYGNPLGPSQVYLAMAPEEDKLVGAVGFSPIRLRIGSVVESADYAHHLAIQPAYRDTLSYLSLMRYAMQGQAAGATTMTIGPPNRTAYPIHKGLMQWRDFGFLDRLQKLSPKARTHSCRQIDRFPEEFDEFYARISRNFKFCVEKSNASVNWRFCQRPGSFYTVYAAQDSRGALGGYVVLKRWVDPDGYRKAHIMDWHAVDDAVLAELLAAAESYADGCNELNLWAVEGYPYRPFLEANGFTPGFRQPLLARWYNGKRVAYPGGACSLMYGDGDTQY